LVPATMKNAAKCDT